jgi:hypothetical protein
VEITADDLAPWQHVAQATSEKTTPATKIKNAPGLSTDLFQNLASFAPEGDVLDGPCKASREWLKVLAFALFIKEGDIAKRRIGYANATMLTAHHTYRAY